MAIDWNEDVEESIEVDDGSSSFVADESNVDILNIQDKNLLSLIDPSFEKEWRSYWKAGGTTVSGSSTVGTSTCNTGNSFNFKDPITIIGSDIINVPDGLRSAGLVSSETYAGGDFYGPVVLRTDSNSSVVTYTPTSTVISGTSGNRTVVLNVASHSLSVGNTIVLEGIVNNSVKGLNDTTQIITATTTTSITFVVASTLISLTNGTHTTNLGTFQKIIPVNIDKVISESGEYTLSFYYLVEQYIYDAGLTSLSMVIRAYDSSGALLSTPYDSFSGTLDNDISIIPDALTRDYIVFTLPANTNMIYIEFKSPSIAIPSYGIEILWIDAIQLEAGTGYTDFEISSYTAIFSTDSYKIKIADSETSDPYFSVSSADKITTIEKLRLTSGEVDASSTNHGFQIGSSDGLNIRMDSNEIWSVSNGSISGLTINASPLNLGTNSGVSTIEIGYGISGTHTNVVSDAIYYDSTTTAGSAVHSYGTTHRLMRYTSTYNLKDNITPLSDFSTLSNSVPTEKITNSLVFNPKNILNIVPVAFNPMGPMDNPQSIEVGFIAEDIADKIPELAVYGDDDIVDFYNIYGVVASMLAVIQEQESKINSLEERLAILENK